MPGQAGTITLCKRTIAILILGVACVYVWALAGVVWTAACAPTSAQGDGVVLVLGKRLTQGQVDTEFQSRLARGAALLRDDTSLRGLISGGGGPVSEARAGLMWLRGNGCQADWQLEEQATNIELGAAGCRERRLW